MVWVEATDLEEYDENNELKVDDVDYLAAWEKLKNADGVVVPGGFGNR